MLVYRKATYAIYILNCLNSLLDLISLGNLQRGSSREAKDQRRIKIFLCSAIGRTDFFLRSDGIAFVDET